MALFPIAPLISLVTAHLLGDFLLQTENDVARKTHFGVLFKHASLLAGLSYLLTGYWSSWHIPVAIFLAHFIFDYLKSRYTRNEPLFFYLDQLAHLLVIALLVVVILPGHFGDDGGFWVNRLGRPYMQALVLLAGWVLAAHAGRVVVGLYVEPLQQELLKAQAKAARRALLERENGFINGGRIIGVLERTLIYLFVLIDQPSGIGFLIAAKSILRFGEIKERTNRMEAEYIIIGTLASFAFGLLASCVCRWVLLALP
ncbi:DUF3307 domain-containing protein [candidate division KSB1 bacterium]|nr:DUF3307 domain-containing protein [candidate division KSB1 bacterium]